MKKAIRWIKNASRTNRVFRTAVQSAIGYVALNVKTLWESGADFEVALEALIVGALAAGISAVWKTAEADLAASQEGGSHD